LIVEHAFAFLPIPTVSLQPSMGWMQNPMSCFNPLMVALPRWEKRNQMQATPASGSSNFAGVATLILPYSSFLYKDNPNP